jgi:hypothetical protein
MRRDGTYALCQVLGNEVIRGGTGHYSGMHWRGEGEGFFWYKHFSSRAPFERVLIYAFLRVRAIRDYGLEIIVR